MRFLVAGYGSIGRRHFRNLRALGQEDLVLLRSGRSTLPEDEIKDVPVVRTIEEGLSCCPDGVIVANPTALHLAVALPALAAGCAVLMEKPIDGGLQPVLAERAALEAGADRFLMGFQYRYHPGLIRVRSLIAENTIGRVLSYRIHWGEYLPEWHPWEDYRRSYAARADLGGGVLRTLCHPLDYSAWLFGEPAQLWGYSGKVSNLELEVDDLAEIGIRHETGIVGSIHLDYFRRVARNDMEIVGSEGVIRWRNDDGQVCVLKPGRTPDLWTPPPGFERNWLFLEEAREFIAVARRTAEPSCTVGDGIRVMRMIEAVRTSMTEERFVRL